MDFYLTSHLVAFVVLTLASMFFSAVEASLLSFPKPLLQSRIQAPGFLGKAFKEWHDHPNRILTTILLGNNAVNVAITTLVAYVAVHFADLKHWNRILTGSAVSGAVIVVLIVFGEAIPKVMGRIHTAKAAQWLVVPIFLFDRLLTPLNWALGHAVALLFPRLGQAAVSLVTEEDVKHLIEMGQASGNIQEEEKRMIHSIFKFTDMKVREAMVPRTDMFCVDIKTD